MTRFSLVFPACIAALATGTVVAVEPAPLVVTARTRATDGPGEAREERRTLDPARCAVVICDVWDDHWCRASAARCDAIAKKMVPVVEAARKRGMTIIHCPSDCMAFYADHPARKRTLALPMVEPPADKKLPDPPLPVDDSDSGCDDAVTPAFRKAWTREHPALRVDENKDFITDSGKQLWAILKAKNLDTVFVMGVHTNRCVLKRSFGIKQLVRWGVPCYLVRDLTDVMYNPAMPPKVTQAAATDMVVAFIERNWCPSVLSTNLTSGK